MPQLTQHIALVLAAGCASGAIACQAESAATVTPVIELYTSEGCSSCPPADKWLTGLKSAAAQGKVVAQAFHVGYWDYIGWIDRFAAPAHTTRQREIAALNRQRSIYTPQLVRNGQDWRDYSSALASSVQPPRAAIRLARLPDGAFEALVTPQPGVGAWGAYWSVTEHGHSSKVKAGENAGEFLEHDFVVRQYVPLGQQQGAQRLKLHAVPQAAGHSRQINLVVFEPKTGQTLQALALACEGNRAL